MDDDGRRITIPECSTRMRAAACPPSRTSSAATAAMALPQRAMVAVPAAVATTTARRAGVERANWTRTGGWPSGGGGGGGGTTTSSSPASRRRGGTAAGGGGEVATLVLGQRWGRCSRRRGGPPLEMVGKGSKEGGAVEERGIGLAAAMAGTYVHARWRDGREGRRRRRRRQQQTGAWLPCPFLVHQFPPFFFVSCLCFFSFSWKLYLCYKCVISYPAKNTEYKNFI